MRRIFDPRRDGNGEWRRFHNEEFHILYRSSIIVRVIEFKRLRWPSHVVRMEEGRGVFKILAGTTTGTGSLGRARRRWVNYIRMDLKEIGINTNNLSIRIIELIQFKIGIIGEPL